ncbi:unnamed protein product [Mytilus edulis]|uniref:Uncharacterized protein n=1 Tax=Mytilus edulis TaxID=6550 RepID=A0A8S3U7U1_MYTED|nr:unnamed protein product [Mytilus edulis]
MNLLKHTERLIRVHNVNDKDMAHNFILLLQISVLLCVLVDLTSAHGADDANPCTSSHCQNGGTCRPDGQTFRCECHEGYGGDFCNLDQPVIHHNLVIGDNVKLECYTNISLPKPLEVEWFKSVDGNNTRVNLTADVTKYAGGTLSKRSLTIYRTSFDDTAGYSCRTNNTAFEVNQEFHHVAVEGVKYECSSLNENQVTLNYIGIAVEVAFADQTNTECLFTPVDDKYDNFTLTKTSEDYFSGRVIVRRTIKGFDTTKDNAFDVHCSYVITTNNYEGFLSSSCKLRVKKVELRVIKVELRVKKVELRVKKVELRVKKVELRVTKVELRVTKVELRVTKVELRVTKVELRVTKVELRVTKVELRVTKVELRVTKSSCELQKSSCELGKSRCELQKSSCELRKSSCELRKSSCELQKYCLHRIFRFDSHLINKTCMYPNLVIPVIVGFETVM